MMAEHTLLLVEDLYEEGFTAGTKATQDVRTILGCDIFYCYRIHSSKMWDYLRSTVRFLISLPSIYGAAHVVVQYPFYTNWRFNEICYRLLPSDSVLLLHDIGSLRYEFPDKKVKAEIKHLNRFRTLIVHNESMEKWLLEQGSTSRLVKLGLFDYLVKPGDPPSEEGKERRNGKDLYTVAFAGNLGKSRFLEKLVPLCAGKLHFALYGLHATKMVKNSGYYKGVKEADVLPDVLEGDFGLVWDGDSEEECQNAEGRYLQYNCPHKFSLYMAAGMPVIVGEHTAMAGFVREHNLGICIQSLKELPERLSGVTSSRYREMQEQVRFVQNRVRAGTYLREALGKCGIEV